jgi:hypothetical protein
MYFSPSTIHVFLPLNNTTISENMRSVFLYQLFKNHC